MYNMKNIVDNIVITSVTDGYWTYCGVHIIRYIKVKSLCCTPGTNIIVHVSYTLMNHKLKTKTKNSKHTQQASVYSQETPFVSRFCRGGR